MTESQIARSPLARLVLFMICVSVAGAFVAGAHYYVIDLPQQNLVQAPANFLFGSSACADSCKASCQRNYDSCINSPKGWSESNPCGNTFNKCKDRCEKNCACSDCRDTCGSRYYACLNQPGYTEGDCAGIAASCRASCTC